MGLISNIYHAKDGRKKSKTRKLPVLPDQPEPQSQAERLFIRRAKANGWELLRAGWPDYMLMRKVKGGIEFQAVEVKQDHENYQLRITQLLMVAALVLQGIKVSIWSSESRTLRRVDPKMARETIDNYFLKIEQEKVRNGLKELRNSRRVGAL